MSDARTNWKNELQRTDDCIPLERLGEQLTAAERHHLSLCARCQTEMTLFQEFRDSETTEDEQQDVEWITSQLKQATPQPSNVVAMSSRRPVFRPRMLAAAAMLVTALGLAYLIQSREPSVNVPLRNEDVYRSSKVDVVAPLDDVANAPSELQWKAVPGTSSYDVRVLEVDRTLLWQTTTREPRVTLPQDVVAQFVPGKTVLWEVTARRDAAVVATSGVQKFRVSTEKRQP